MTAGEIGGVAVSQVTTLGQVHAHHGVARIEQCQEHSGVGLGPGMRLDVGVIAIEQHLDPLDGQALSHVDILATAVVALARVTFGVLVGEYRVLNRHHQWAGVVLGGDQLDVIFLAAFFVVNRLT
nr:hypothetical protein GCM10020185_60970 [Pseudomonas brassicacearum subsp. brassicacearum]